ncbi:MAG: SufE family protein [Planctomycetota bacterium]|nr:SufE family protein [Planctomycetota bacterium]MDW8372588.1 SufE family protein [Planctomycetota bacterium]
MPSILEKQAALVEEFAALPDWEARYARLIAMARALPPLPEELRTEEHRVRGCSSQVWMVHDFRDGCVHLRADSDAVLVRGLIALLLQVYSGHSPREILGAPPDFLADIGLHAHLSPNRANGLASMAARIREIAAACQSTEPPLVQRRC